MKVKINRPIRVNCLPCEVEVDHSEYQRLLLLGAIDTVKEEKEIPEKKVRSTRKK